MEKGKNSLGYLYPHAPKPGLTLTTRAMFCLFCLFSGQVTLHTGNGERGPRKEVAHRRYQNSAAKVIHPGVNAKNKLFSEHHRRVGCVLPKVAGNRKPHWNPPWQREQQLQGTWLTSSSLLPPSALGCPKFPLSPTLQIFPPNQLLLCPIPSGQGSAFSKVTPS